MHDLSGSEGFPKVGETLGMSTPRLALRLPTSVSRASEIRQECTLHFDPDIQWVTGCALLQPPTEPKPKKPKVPSG